MWTGCLLLFALQCGVLAQRIKPPSSAIDFPKNHKTINASKICDEPGCSCRRTSGVKVARCVCRKKAMDLTLDKFSGDDRVAELHVEGTVLCPMVTVKSGTFSSSSIMRVHMEGLEKVMLKPDSFKVMPTQPQFTIDFHNVKELVMNSHTFSGPILRISIVNTTTSVPGKAFVGVSGEPTSITFENSTIRTIKTQAFMGSQLSNLTFKSCSIETIETKGVQPERITSCQLTDCAVHDLRRGALTLNPGQLGIHRCRFGAVAEGAFQVRCSGLAWLHNNTFSSVSAGAFSQISPTGSAARLEFHGNQLQELEPDSLRFSDEYSRDQLSLRRLTMQQRCRCHLRDWLSLVSGSPAHWLLERLAATATCRADDGAVAVAEFVAERCGDDRQARRTGWRRLIVGVAIGVSVLVAAVCGITGIIAWRQALRRRREQRDRDRAAADALRHRPHKLNNANLYADGRDGGWQEPEPPRRPRLVIAVPDVKTYTETELHVVLETLESLEPTVLPRLPSTGTLERLRDGPRPARRRGDQADEPQSPGCRKSCPL